MACSCLFKTEEEKGWLKCWKALFVTRDGLSDFVENTIHSIYKPVNCPVSSVASPNAGAVSQQSCCQHFEKEIQKYRSGWNKLKERDKWQNSDKTKLCSSEWEFAKCFIHATGYKDKTSIQETDLNGIISIIKNCSEFQNYFSFPLSQQGQPLEQVYFTILFCIKLSVCL